MNALARPESIPREARLHFADLLENHKTEIATRGKFPPELLKDRPIQNADAENKTVRRSAIVGMAIGGVMSMGHIFTGAALGYGTGKAINALRKRFTERREQKKLEKLTPSERLALIEERIRELRK